MAKLAGTTPGAIQQILNGSTKRTRFLLEIATALDVRAEWLAGAQDVEHTNGVNTGDELSEHFTVITYRSDVSIEGTAPDAPIGNIALQTFWLRDIVPNFLDLKLFMWRVHTTQMSPTINVGDDVLLGSVDEWDRDPDGIWLVDVGGRILVRRARQQGHDIILISDNSSYPPTTFAAEQLKFRAKVLWQGRKLSHS